jgi:hypothetical protein
MLAETSVNENVNSTDHFAPLQVILPKELQKFYSERGYLATIPHEDRGHVRLNVRSKALIRFYPPVPGLQADLTSVDERQGTVLVKDLSKTGVAFLYHRQIFPSERFDILINGRALNATAVRCRRVGHLCYETGATINCLAFEPAAENP